MENIETSKLNSFKSIDSDIQLDPMAKHKVPKKTSNTSLLPIQSLDFIFSIKFIFYPFATSRFSRHSQSEDVP